MTQKQWTRVDEYLTDLLVSSDPNLEAALAASDAGGLPQIQVAPNQGKFLMLLARALGARTILEIGTLGGYSNFLKLLSTDPRLSATAIQTVGTKGHDGFALAVMTKDP